MRNTPHAIAPRAQLTVAVCVVILGASVFAWSRSRAAQLPGHGRAVGSGGSSSGEDGAAWLQLAMQQRVNERRAARGLAPYPYPVAPLPGPPARVSTT